MRTLRTIAVVLAFVCALSAGASGSGAAPTLRARSFAPFSVRGTGFQQAEHVRVTLESVVPHVVRVQANAYGTFTALFRGVTVERCDGFSVRAVGSKGSVAVARARPLMCPSTNPG